MREVGEDDVDAKEDDTLVGDDDFTVDESCKAEVRT